MFPVVSTALSRAWKSTYIVGVAKHLSTPKPLLEPVNQSWEVFLRHGVIGPVLDGDGTLGELEARLSEAE